MKNKSSATDKKIPVSLKLVAGFLVFSSLLAYLPMLFQSIGINFGPPELKEFAEKSIGYKVGAYFRANIFNLVCIASGVGIFLKKQWARKMAMAYLVISIPYTGNEFAWGFVGGRPDKGTYMVSLAITAIVNGICFFVIYRKKSADVFRSK